MNVIEKTGSSIIGLVGTAGGTILLFFKSIYWLKSFIPNRGRIIAQMDAYGVGSLPIVFLVSIFSGMVLALQTGMELGRFRVEEMVGSIVAISMAREMGPVITAVIVAGRAGAAMAAELATMKVSEEIDALESMSINPVRFLAMPRIVSLLVMMPLLTVLSIFIGILGGSAIAHNIMNVHYLTFLQRGIDFLQVRDLAVGIVKAAFFGSIIASVSCYQGMNASGGAEGVGKTTTRAVVVSFVFVMITNYLITGFFYD